MAQESTSDLETLICESEQHSFTNNSYRSEHGVYTRASPDFLAWITACEHFIKTQYSENSSPYEMFKKANLRYFNGYESGEFNRHKNFILGALKACARIQPAIAVASSNRSQLDRIFDRFHLVARQLRARYDSRNTIDVSDEYDVQDVLHCLLRLYFDDIRKEEWTPSYAGGSSRMDFLLKEELVVIEVKMTRKGLNDRELGKQLIEDKAKYKVHPDCKSLICFTYDPEGRISNPRGLENDLNQDESDFKVRIIIKP